MERVDRFGISGLAIMHDAPDVAQEQIVIRGERGDPGKDSWSG
jgi:hypothetical protein